MPRAFITGVTGQDGQHLAEFLKTQGQPLPADALVLVRSQAVISSAVASCARS